MKARFLILSVFLATAVTAHAQTIGGALVGHSLNRSDARSGAGAGLWLTVPLGGSGWSLGPAISYTSGHSRYHKYKPGAQPWGNTYYRYRTNIFSVSVIAPRQLLDKSGFGIALGPSLGYATFGVKEYDDRANRVFAGLWANFNYALTTNVKLELVLHPRWSPGREADYNVYGPYERGGLTLTEGWFGVSYNLGGAK